MKLKFKDKELDVKYGIAEELLFSEITKGRLFKAQSLQDCFYMMWCCMQVAYGQPITFKEITEYVDSDPEIFVSFLNYLTEYFSQLTPIKKD